MNRLENLQEVIERHRNRLDEMIVNGIDEESFYRANVELDSLIEEYIRIAEQEEVLAGKTKE